MAKREQQSRDSRVTFYNDQTPRTDRQIPLYEAPRRRSAPPNLRHWSRRATIVVVLVLLIAGSALIYYASVVRINQQKALATATVAARVTATSQAIAVQTFQANAKLTATAQTRANATATAVAQARAEAQATAAVLQNIYAQATSGNPTLSDLMTQQDSNTWEIDAKSGGGGCAFKDGSYHASMPQTGFFASCYAQSSNFSNFAYQVDMTILAGDRGGIIFRSDNASKFYLFRIDQHGQYDLFLYIDNNGSNTTNLLEGSSRAIQTGINHKNRVTVVARNSNVYVYVNQQYIASVSDSTYTSGSIGVFAEDHTQPTEVAFSNVEVWKL